MKKISLVNIKKLREKTGAGVMEVKRALEASRGDEARAALLLRQSGFAKAEKRADRMAAEGRIASYVHQGGKIAALVEVGCETDFVARTPELARLASELAMQIASMEPADVKELLKQEYIREPGKTVADLIAELVGKTGEKIEVHRFVRFELGRST